MIDAEAGSGKAHKLGVKRINEMSLAYQQAGVLWAGIELELFTMISQGAHTLEEVGQGLELDLETADRLLTACLAMGLIEKNGEKYSNAPDVERYLVRGKPTYHGDWALYHKNGYEQWKNLAATLRPVTGYYQRIRTDPKAARELTTAGYHSSIGSGRKLARECDLSSYTLLLDLGGGSGVYSIMACQKYPNLRAIVFDFPTVCTVSGEFIAEAGLSDRIKTWPGDYISDEYPKGIDAILICGTLEPRDSADHQLVLKKAFHALPPKGLLIFITNMLEPDKSGPLEAVFSNLGNVLGPRPWGRIHTSGELTNFLSKAGFVDVAISDFVPGTYYRITARKPE